MSFRLLISVTPLPTDIKLRTEMYRMLILANVNNIRISLIRWFTIFTTFDEIF